jgi:hypothetical protein
MNDVADWKMMDSIRVRVRIHKNPIHVLVGMKYMVWIK